MAENATIIGDVKIGENCSIWYNAVLRGDVNSIRIGNNCWIGAGALIMPGVTIGDNTVIGAGSVVTHDIPSGVVAVGNPCRVMREIGEHDKEFYFKDKRVKDCGF